MDYKFFTDMMRDEVNKQPSPDLKIGRKVVEDKKEKKEEETPLADITKVEKGEGPSIDTKQPEAPEQKGESLEDEADQIKSLKDNDKKDQVSPEIVEEPKGKKKVKEGKDTGWTCPKCGTKAKRERAEYLNQPFDTDEEEPQFDCEKCGAKFSSNGTVAEAMYIGRTPEERADEIMDEISEDENLGIIRDALAEIGEDDSIMDDIYDDTNLGIIRDALEAYFANHPEDEMPPPGPGAAGSGELEVPPMPESKINEAPLQGKSEEDKEATAAGEEPPTEEPAPAPEPPKEDMGGKPPKKKEDEEGIPEEPATEEPKKKVTLGKSADQFFYFQPNDQGGMVLDAEEKELKKINPGPILPQILDIVRELKIDLVGAQFVTDYILPEIEAKHNDEEKAKKEFEPKEELPTEPEPEKTEELPVPPAMPNESVSKDFLTQLYEGQEGML
jgi:hypothetical protein